MKSEVMKVDSCFHVVYSMHAQNMSPSHRHIQTFFWGGGGADPEAVYKLCLILKTMFPKSYQNLWATIYVGYRES